MNIAVKMFVMVFTITWFANFAQKINKKAFYFVLPVVIINVLIYLLTKNSMNFFDNMYSYIFISYGFLSILILKRILNYFFSVDNMKDQRRSYHDDGSFLVENRTISIAILLLTMLILCLYLVLDQIRPNCF
jgi:hypothetical protein